MFKNRVPILLAAALVSVLAVACSKDKGKGADQGKTTDVKPGETKPGETKPTGGSAVAVAAPAMAGSPLDLLPKDTAFVFGMSFDKVRQTKLWEQFAKPALEKASAELGEIKTACNIDFVNDATSAIVAGSDFNAEDKVIMIVKGKWDEEKANKCLVTMAEKKEGKKIEIKKEGKLTVYTQNGESIYAAWIAADTVVLTGKPEAKDYLASIVERKSSLKDNADLSSLVAKTDMTATLWGAAVIPPEAAGAAAGMGGDKPPKAMYATINLTKALDAKIGLRFDAEQTAKDMVAKAQKEMEGAMATPPFGDFLKGVKMTVDGADAVVTIALAEAQIDQLIAMATQQLAPLLMGGMMGGGGMPE